MKNYAIILASGTGDRTGLEIPKQFVKIAGKTVLEHTLKVFQYNKNIDFIIVVANKYYLDITNSITENFNKVIKVIEGGETRKQSSSIGLSAIKDENAKVLIHDAVRPFVSSRIIDDCINALDKYKAVDVAITSADTIIKVSSASLIEDIPQRNLLRRGQTPQAFDLQTIKTAHKMADSEQSISVTDDCSLVLKFKLADVYVVKGDESNIKITYPIDIAIADKLFQLRTSAVDKIDFSKLKDKVIIVFGGFSGIGEAIVTKAENYGAKVYAYSRRNGVDITDINSIKHAFNETIQKEHNIDFVINTAGKLKFEELIKRNTDDIVYEIASNYTGCINIAKISFEYLKKSKGGMLFFASSSYTRGRKNYAVYSSAKAAVVNFTQALSEEWEEFGIKVNVIVPQRTATSMRFENFGKEPSETLLTPDFVADISLNTLLSNVTGQVVTASKNIISS